MQTPGPDILMFFVDQTGDFRKLLDCILADLQGHSFGFHQFDILTDQSVFRFLKDANKVILVERVKFHPNRKAALHLGNQI